MSSSKPPPPLDLMVRVVLDEVTNDDILTEGRAREIEQAESTDKKEAPRETASDNEDWRSVDCASLRTIYSPSVCYNAVTLFLLLLLLIVLHSALYPYPAYISRNIRNAATDYAAGKIAETARCFVSLNISLSHSRSLEVTPLSRACISPYYSISL